MVTRLGHCAGHRATVHDIYPVQELQHDTVLCRLLWALYHMHNEMVVQLVMPSSLTAHSREAVQFGVLCSFLCETCCIGVITK